MNPADLGTRLSTLDHEKLISNINQRLGTDSSLVQGRMRKTFPWTRSEYKIPLVLENDGDYGILAQMVGLNSERVGYVLLKREERDIGTEGETAYEELSLNIRTPIELEGNITIPRCTVDILRTEFVGPSNPQRRNLVYDIDSTDLREPEDLEEIVPTEWFLRDIGE